MIEVYQIEKLIIQSSNVGEGVRGTWSGDVKSEAAAGRRFYPGQEQNCDAERRGERVELETNLREV